MTLDIEIKDVLGLSKPLTKLLEVVSSGMGNVYRPIAIRKEADAKAYAIQITGDAETSVDAKRREVLATSDANSKYILADRALDIEERTRARMMHREVQKQSNLEAIADAASEHLPEQVSTQTVDDDWKMRFFDIAENVSNKDMQQLWGKILAGEVAAPGAFSLRALEVMRNLTQREAEVFQRIRYLALDSGTIFKTKKSGDLKEFGISFADILVLREAGLVLAGDTLSGNINVEPDWEHVALGYNDAALLIAPVGDNKVLRVSQYMLSNAGIELLKLIEPAPNLKYLTRIADENQTLFSFSIGKFGTMKETFERLGSIKSD